MTSRLLLTELRNEAHVSGFAAACAGAGEFEQRFQEHGLLDEVLVDLGTVEFREIDEEVPALAFLNLDGFLRHHVDGLLGFVGLVLADTGLRTDAATRTVVAGHGNREHRLFGAFQLEALGRGVLEAFRSVLHCGFVNDLHADGCMRADCGDRSASPHSRLRRLVMTSRLRLTAHLPHCTQASGFQLGMFRARSRFSYLVVAVGNTPSQGILETGRSSPLPLMISAVGEWPMGVPAHICAVGLYFRGCRHRSGRRQSPKTETTVSAPRGHYP